MKVHADWSEKWTAEQIEGGLADVLGIEGPFQFKGPGLYLGAEWTVLITANPDEGDDPGTEWNRRSRHAIYPVYVYRASFSLTIFAGIAAAPIRIDDR